MPAITDIRAYADLDTDNEPRFLCRDSAGRIFLDVDSGAQVGVIQDSGSSGVSMIPFRPNQSIEPWMYIGGTNDYKKFSTPDSGSNGITVREVGIAEQHSPPEVCPNAFSYYNFTNATVNWTPSGTAGTLFDADHWSGTNTTGAAVLPDPASGPYPRYSIEVDPAYDYEIGLVVNFFMGGSTYYLSVIEDVIPAVNDGNELLIDSIFYYSGTTGRCVIVPTAMAVGNVPGFTGNTPSQGSIFQPQVLSTLRRGSLVSLNSTETCFVLSATTGPNGQVCFEVETTGTFSVGDTIQGLAAIVCCNGPLSPFIAGTPLGSFCIDSAISGAGSAIYTQALSLNPFNTLMNPAGTTAQPEDLISVNFFLNEVADVTSIQVAFMLSTAGDSLSYTTTPAALIGTAALGLYATHVQMQFPISALVRGGNNPALTLADCISVVITIVTTDAVGVQIGSLLVGGGGQPDVGLKGSPYFYSNVTRSSDTGVPSNPSPISRYGVSPRRQSVNIINTDDVGDPQANTWDQYRFGGSVNSFRFIGSTPNNGYPDPFTDNYSDAAALAGSLVQYDNFQPWPTIDAPYNAVVGTQNGITTDISVVGTSVVVTYSAPSGPFPDPAPATILRWLPGTLMLLGGQSAYTLWNRPTLITLDSPPTAFYYAYLFNLVENAGAFTPDTLTILEPNVAEQALPYLWGPDAQGTVFGCGDPFRPGRLYYAKPYAPDAAPDRNSQELTPPSEPLLGGETIDGISFAASPDRWWGLFPQIGNNVNPYQAVERPVGRGLAAPYGHCTDGKNGYFWAKDGIWITPGFGVGASLTDPDLFNLFPHEGVEGRDITYAGYTIYSPDYARAGAFRLAFGASYLYADYLDSTGTPRTLVCDLRDPSAPKWCVDEYGEAMRCHYAVEQQAGTVQSQGATYPRLVMGSELGNVYEQRKLVNDNGVPIDAAIATFEEFGGDIRQDNLFNDAFLDVKPESGIDVTPISGRVPAAGSTAIPLSPMRQQTNVPVGLELKYMGILLEWTDDFSSQTMPTVIYGWQPMLQGVPIAVFQWKTQGTSFGLLAYFHIRQINFAYRSAGAEDITLTITVYDGQNPDVITLPGTSGELRKVMFPLTPNKGMLYFFEGVCTEEWQAYVSESEFHVGQWNRTDPYQIFRGIEAPTGIS